MNDMDVRIGLNISITGALPDSVGQRNGIKIVRQVLTEVFELTDEVLMGKSYCSEEFSVNIAMDEKMTDSLGLDHLPKDYDIQLVYYKELNHAWIHRQSDIIIHCCNDSNSVNINDFLDIYVPCIVIELRQDEVYRIRCIYDDLITEYSANLLGDYIKYLNLLSDEETHRFRFLWNEAGLGDREEISDVFNRLDQLALDYHGKYNGLTRLKTKLPMWTAITLGFGFYFVFFVGLFTGIDEGHQSFGMLLGWVTAIAFLLHGVLNGALFTIKRSQKFDSLQYKFVAYRYMAEALRVYTAYDQLRMPADIVGYNAYKNVMSHNGEVLFMLRCLIRKYGFMDLQPDDSNFSRVYESIDQLIKGQIAYHEKTIDKNEKHITMNRRIGEILLALGILTVLIRGVIQVYLQFGHIESADDYKTFFNALAFLVPSAASFFLLKLDMFRYGVLVSSSRHVLDFYYYSRKRILKHKHNDVQRLEDLIRILDGVKDISLNEVTDWFKEMY